MKSKLLLAAALCGILFSCSSDDSSSDNPTPDTNFTISLITGKYWTYDVEDSNANQFRDSLYISGDTLINGITHKKFKVKDDVAAGFYSSSLRNNGVRESDNKLLLSGDLSLGMGEQLPIALDLTLSNFVIFKKNAAVNEQLSSKTGVIEQEFSGYPIKINYTLKSFGGETISNFTSPNNDVYTNVRTSKIVLRASITTEQSVGGFPITVTIMPEQDVLISRQYIADEIGVAYVKTEMQYQLASLPPTIPIPFPDSGSQTQEEFLDTYN
ncbi:hypothetical protein [Flavobacterium suncheonense]|uniref:Lipoprotein n=1 Tax=Flavobacterium suncheonense GH29-5 = DSM 17707 TaxID=1121899 RepID=A0A0A2MNU6_9FLAO|nr:hypothetical protein [Flavobacterium suncheonense]KGO89965.1 hypothetical protein Q764_04980 [Flavobacterium suncheonense GH29-5 = DSM 17707]